MRRYLVVLILILAFGVVAVPAGATTPSTVSPPPSMTADCSANMAYHMQHWLMSLPANTTVVAPAGACYLIDGGITLVAAQGLTIAGGTWEDETAPQTGASPTALNAAFWLQGGSNITLENLTIAGSNPGGYDPSGAFAGGIRSDGVIGLHVTDVNVDNVWGDGLELAPLREANDIGSNIINPSENVSVSGLKINGAGRQGVSLVSVNGATLTDVTLRHVGIDNFDVEADQWDEGAKNVTINGCQAGDAGGLFFANGGESAEGSWFTGNITVENCTMTSATAGEAVLVQAPSSMTRPRGPFTFVNDTLRCGASVYVACIQANEADLTVTNSDLIWPAGEIREPVFHVSESTGLDFTGDSVSGYGIPGWKDNTSTVNIAGGQWAPYAAPGPVHSGVGGAATTAPMSAGGAPATTSTSTTSSTTTTSTTQPARLASLDHHHKQKGTLVSVGGPTTATVLTSNGNDPLTSPLGRAAMALDLGAGAVAYAFLELRRRRRVQVVPATHSIQDLLGRPRRSGSA